MNIEITFRHIELPKALREYAAKQLERLERFGEEFVKGEFVFIQEAGEVACEAILHRHQGEPFVAHDRAPEGRTAVDNVVDKLNRQILKFKEKHSAQARRNRAAE
ncbi:MAG: ribosome-associated translation inhibitor RaiA [Planctomycetota bacterium]|nr:ribosome-associated translation inhibitor RaiA [Planctomycetota bacterium]MDA1112856.1 ribosome-associated translation inhibitor RaiA [Planctomycetota bacterium]